MLTRHEWDTVQMPVNVCDVHYRSFIRRVIPEAEKRNIGVIGMKSLGGGADRVGRFPSEKVCTHEEARIFALSQPIASLVVGVDSMDVLRQDIRTIGRPRSPNGHRRPPRAFQIDAVLRRPLSPAATRFRAAGDGVD
jgi:predicted aldo/keto reductase-like oxidoreductase